MSTEDQIEVENIGGGIFQYLVKFEPQGKSGRLKYLSTPKVKTHNCIKQEFESNIIETGKSNPNSQKRVSFAEKPSVSIMHTWRFAHRLARMGRWQQAACDRYRFRTRIDAVGRILSSVLMEKYSKGLQTEL